MGHAFEPRVVGEAKADKLAFKRGLCQIATRHLLSSVADLSYQLSRLLPRKGVEHCCRPIAVEVPILMEVRPAQMA